VNIVSSVENHYQSKSKVINDLIFMIEDEIRARGEIKQTFDSSMLYEIRNSLFGIIRGEAEEADHNSMNLEDIPKIEAILIIEHNIFIAKIETMEQKILKKEEIEKLTERDEAEIKIDKKHFKNLINKKEEKKTNLKQEKETKDIKRRSTRHPQKEIGEKKENEKERIVSISYKLSAPFDMRETQDIENFLRYLFDVLMKPKANGEKKR